MIENRFVSGETSFIDMSKNGTRVLMPGPARHHAEPALPIYAASTLGTSMTAPRSLPSHRILRRKQVRLVGHRIFQPTPEEPFNFEAPSRRPDHLG